MEETSIISAKFAFFVSFFNYLENQKERGATSIYLNSEGALYNTELAQQRLATDRAVASLLDLLDSRADLQGTQFDDDLSGIRTLLSSRAKLRASGP